MGSLQPFTLDLLGGLPDLLSACLGTKADTYASKETVDIHDFLFEITPGLSSGGSLKRVKKLLKAGASVNSEYQGLTALLVSVASGDPAIVQELLAAGAQADVNDQTHDYSSPLMVAAAVGNPKIVKLLLDAGARPNQQDNRGQTPLHLAALLRQVDACKLLLGHGADVNGNGHRVSPLCLAITIVEWDCWTLRAAPALALQVGMTRPL